LHQLHLLQLPLLVFLAEIENQVAAARVQTPIVPSGTVDDICEAELKTYLATESLPIEYNGPLLLWKKHEVFFPILAILAKFYLSVEATSTPSERVSSAANRVIGVRRTSLHPAMAERLLFVSRNWE
jgi:hAT family C-terminal dimerisation region